MAENVSSVAALHHLLRSVEKMLSMEPQSAAEFKSSILALKPYISQLEEQATQFTTTASSSQTSVKLTPAEEQEMAALRAEKAGLLTEIKEQDAQLLKLLSQLRRLQFSLDAMDASAYQSPYTSST